ncbi:hypothetical protein D3C81_1952510 [compost metagenome]
MLTQVPWRHYFDIGGIAQQEQAQPLGVHDPALKCPALRVRGYLLMLIQRVLGQTVEQVRTQAQLQVDRRVTVNRHQVFLHGE